MAPEFSGANIQGHDRASVSLRSLRGRYVFVNFFASWCGPCQQEAPDLIAFDYQNAPKDGADMVSVIFHDQVASAESFLKTQGAPWPAVDDPDGSIAEHYGVTGPPTTFLVDPSGRITVEPETGPATQTELQDMIDQARKLARRSGGAGSA
jgi:peroxiredoxin